MDAAAYWDNEAVTDPRYKQGRWHINIGDDPDTVLVEVLRRIWPHIPAEGQVIEIGCGPGRLLLPSAENFPNVSFIGIDASKQMLALAASRRAEVALPTNNVALFCLTDLAYFEPNAGEPHDVDLIFMVEVAQHITDTELADYIRQSHNILRPGGKLIVQFVNQHARGNEGPYSHPRTMHALLGLFNEGWSGFNVWHGEVHEQWSWVLATR